MKHFQPTFALWVVLPLLGLGVALASGDGSGPQASENRPAAVEPFVDAVSKVRASTVAVGTYRSGDTPSIQYAGTGFVVDDGWTVATNQHVVEAIRQNKRLDHMQVFFPDRRPTEGRPARVVAEDRHHDVALLVFEGPPGWALDLDTTEAAQGTDVGVLGYPIGLQLGLVPAAHRGVIAAVVPAVLPLPTGARLTPELIEAIRRPYNLYQLDMVVYPGNSGSPMFSTRTGKVIGIINRTLATRTREHLLTKPSGISYAVPVEWVDNLIKTHKRRTPEASSTDSN